MDVKLQGDFLSVLFKFGAHHGVADELGRKDVDFFGAECFVQRFFLCRCIITYVIRDEQQAAECGVDLGQQLALVKVPKQR